MSEEVQIPAQRSDFAFLGHTPPPVSILTYLLSVWVPARGQECVCMCICVCVWVCVHVIVFFEHVLNWTYYILINIIQHEHRKSSKHTAALFSLSSFIRGKNTQMSRGFGPPIQSRALITPHTPFTISSAQGWVGVSSHFSRAVHLKHRGIQRGETTGAFNCLWCLLGCCAAAFYFNVKASLNKTDSSL